MTEEQASAVRRVLGRVRVCDIDPDDGPTVASLVGRLGLAERGVTQPKKGVAVAADQITVDLRDDS